MKNLIWLLFIIFSVNSWAQDKLIVTVEPRRPIVNETFNVVFKVSSEEAKNIEEINFKSPGLTIVGQSQQGVSTKTVYANGKLTVTRELTVVYELQANNYGTKFIRDIKARVDGKEISHPMISFEVLKEPQVAPDVFVMVDVPKTDVFVGEGIVARYYLYSKVSVSNLDVKKYPKLNNFLKRYLQEPDRSERVSVDGDVYIRNLIYAAKLFPEKPGALKIDPLSLSVTYSKRNVNDPFNVFSSPRDMRTRTISSETVNLNVLPWPTPVPKDFTGLVGKHDFTLNMSQSKLVVNQPLEVTLSVSGPGALENFEAPKLLENKSLEEFESNGELKIQDTDLATKVFTYTYLAAAPVEIPKEQITFSYLDPTTAQYVQVHLDRGELYIGGQARSERSKTSKPATTRDFDTKIDSQDVIELKDLASNFSWKKWQNYINAALGLGAIVILLSFTGLGISRNVGNKVIVPAHFKKNFDYHSFVQWLAPVMVQEAKSPKEVINELEITDEAKKYFEDLLDSSDVSKFSINKKDYNYAYKEKHFKELASKIEKYNESHS